MAVGARLNGRKMGRQLGCLGPVYHFRTISTIRTTDGPLQARKMNLKIKNEIAKSRRPEIVQCPHIFVLFWKRFAARISQLRGNAMQGWESGQFGPNLNFEIENEFKTTKAEYKRKKGSCSIART